MCVHDVCALAILDGIIEHSGAARAQCIDNNDDLLGWNDCSHRLR